MNEEYQKARDSVTGIVHTFEGELQKVCGDLRNLSLESIKDISALGNQIKPALEATTRPLDQTSDEEKGQLRKKGVDDLVTKVLMLRKNRKLKDLIQEYKRMNFVLLIPLEVYSTSLFGECPQQSSQNAGLLGVQRIRPQTFCTHQRKFLNQAVHNVWEKEVITLMSKLDDVVQLSGDARCDSMGHCAK